MRGVLIHEAYAYSSIFKLQYNCEYEWSSAYEWFIAVVRQNALVIKVGMAHTAYQAHEACIEI